MLYIPVSVKFKQITQKLKLTGGGRILHIPDFSAIGRILAMYPSGSVNSSHDGSNTGHSGGGINSSPASIALKAFFKEHT